MSDNLGKNESCISCWIRENPSHCWQKQTYIHIYILSRHAHPEWLTVSTTVEYASFQRWGKHHMQPKCGESKGQSCNRRSFFFSFLQMIRGNSDVQNESIRSRVKRKNRKEILLDLRPVLLNIFNQAFERWSLLNVGVDMLWLQLLIALTLCPWELLARNENYPSDFHVFKDGKKSLFCKWKNFHEGKLKL